MIVPQSFLYNFLYGFFSIPSCVPCRNVTEVHYPSLPPSVICSLLKSILLKWVLSSLIFPGICVSRLWMGQARTVTFYMCRVSDTGREDGLERRKKDVSLFQVQLLPLVRSDSWILTTLYNSDDFPRPVHTLCLVIPTSLTLGTFPQPWLNPSIWKSHFNGDHSTPFVKSSTPTLRLPKWPHPSNMEHTLPESSSKPCQISQP